MSIIENIIRNTNLIMFLGLGIVSIFQVGCKAQKVINQPVEYNHSIHINDVGLECVECHFGVENRDRATLPSLEICEDCHSEMNG